MHQVNISRSEEKISSLNPFSLGQAWAMQKEALSRSKPGLEFPKVVAANTLYTFPENSILNRLYEFRREQSYP